MILGFKQNFPWGKPTNFKEKILSGQKKHSIREDGKRRWKVGMLIHMAYGVRTKFYECFCDKHRCTGKQEIKIKWSKSKVFVSVDIDHKVFYTLQGGVVFIDKGMIELAKNDGFDSVEDFFRWFSEDTKPNTFIIHWTDLRY